MVTDHQGMDDSGLRATAARGVVWSLLGAWGAKATQTVILVLLARLLLPEDFGVVALATVFTALLAFVRDQGFAQAIIQRRDLQPAHLDTSFWTAVLIGLAFTALMQVVAAPLAGAFDSPQLEGALRWLSINFTIGGLRGTPAALLRRELRFKALAARNLVATAAGGVAAVAVAALGGGVWALVAQALVDITVSTIAVWWAVKWRPTLRFSARHFKELFGFSSNVLGINLSNFAHQYSDDALIGAVLGPVRLGIYTVAYRLVRLIGELFAQAIGAVTLPTFSRLQDDDDRLRRATSLSLRAIAAASVPAFVGLVLTAPELIALLFGTRWSASVPVMQILAIGAIAQPITMMQSDVMLAAGKQRAALVLNVCNAIASVLGFAIAVRHGLLAVAAAFSIRAYLMVPFGIYLTWRTVQTDARTYLRPYAVPGLAAIAMAVAVAVVDLALGDRPLALLLGAKLLVGGASYVVALRLLSAELSEELVGLIRLARSSRAVQAT